MPRSVRANTHVRRASTAQGVASFRPDHGPRVRPVTAERIRILLFAAIYGRPVLTRLILRHYDALLTRLTPELGRLEMLVVGSEGDASRNLCADLPSIRYVEAMNDPLNRKYNAGLLTARRMNPDALVVVGSDDMVSANLLRAYAGKIAAGVPVFGLRDLWFFDAVTQRLGYWPGYNGTDQAHRLGEPIGCGRCFTRDVLELVDWRLWPDDPPRNSVMDLHSMLHVRSHGVECQAFTLAELNGHAVDVKVGRNITEFEKIRFAHVERGPLARAYLPHLFDPIGCEQLKYYWCSPGVTP